MKEVIDQFFDAEQKAANILSRSQQEAQQITEQADTQIRQLKSEIIKNAQEKARKLKDDTLKQAESQKASMMAKLADEIARSFKTKEAIVSGLVQEIVNKVVSG